MGVREGVAVGGGCPLQGRSGEDGPFGEVHSGLTVLAQNTWAWEDRPHGWTRTRSRGALHWGNLDFCLTEGPLSPGWVAELVRASPGYAKVVEQRIDVSLFLPLPLSSINKNFFKKEKPLKGALQNVVLCINKHHF